MSVLSNNIHFKTSKKRNEIHNAISVLSPFLALSVASGVSILWWNAKFTKLTSHVYLKIFVTLLTLINIVHLIFLPFGLSVVTKNPNLNTTKSTDLEEDTPNTHLTIKLTIPFLVSLVGFLNKLKILGTMQNQFIPIVHKLLLLEKKLQYPSEKLLEERKYVFYVLIGMFLYSFPMQLMLLFLKISLLNFSLFLYTIYSNFSIFSIEFQFCILSVLITRRLRTLHEKITAIKASKCVNGVYTVQKDLQILKDVHQDLNDVCRMVIDYYNVPILMSLTYLTINSFMNIYFAIFGGFKDAGVKETVSKRPNLEIVGHYFYTTYYFSRFCFICVVADRMMSEVGNTKLYLAEILNSHSLGDLHKQVKHFFTYASCKKLKFTICGLFKLEVSVITTAVATAATYLVVLLQFHKI